MPEPPEDTGKPGTEKANKVRGAAARSQATASKAKRHGLSSRNLDEWVISVQEPEQNLYDTYQDVWSLVRSNQNSPVTWYTQNKLDLEDYDQPRRQQDLITKFFLQNSPTLADFPMCRMFPIFLYAEKAPTTASLRRLFAKLDVTQLDVLPPLHGSWFSGFFGTDIEPLTLEQFWDKHRHLHKAKDIIGSLGLIGASVSLIGTLMTRSTRPVQAAPPPPHQQIDAPQMPTSPPTQITINIYGLTNNIAGLVQAKTPEQALKIIEKMEAEAQAESAPVPRIAIQKTKKVASKKAAPDDTAKLRKLLSGPRSDGVVAED